MQKQNEGHGLKFCCRIWLGLSDLFQTFEDLESVVDKEAEIANIRELLDKDDVQQNDEKEPLC